MRKTRCVIEYNSIVVTTVVTKAGVFYCCNTRSTWMQQSQHTIMNKRFETVTCCECFQAESTTRLPVKSVNRELV